MDIICSHNIYFKNANEMDKQKEKSVDLIITSPPYFDIIDYGNPNQLGYNMEFKKYMDELCIIINKSIKLLKNNRKLCINLGEKFTSSSESIHKTFEITPLPQYLLVHLLQQNPNLVYKGTIFWRKITTSNTSGGGNCMGSIYSPRNMLFFTNVEYILIFEKVGKDSEKKNEYKEYSYITPEERKLYCKDTWEISPDHNTNHPATFPEELPKRLIKMYSFIGDTILDPFLGSGTTSLSASMLGRNSIGYELGFGIDYKNIIQNKIQQPEVLYSYPILEKNSMNGEKKPRTFVKEYGKINILNNYYYYE